MWDYNSILLAIISLLCDTSEDETSHTLSNYTYLYHGNVLVVKEDIFLVSEYRRTITSLVTS